MAPEVVTTPTCANSACLKTLVGSYWSHVVTAEEKTMTANPDGSGMAWTQKAISTCSWRCMARVIAAFAEPIRDPDEDPF